MKVKIHKGDTIEVISGREEDRGKRGEVIKVLPDDGRVVVQGVNMRTKHQRQVQRHRAIRCERAPLRGHHLQPQSCRCARQAGQITRQPAADIGTPLCLVEIAQGAA